MIPRAMHRSSRLSALQQCRHKSSPPGPSHDLVYLNPHKWEGLPADRIFELHRLRKTQLGDKYVPNDKERQAVLSTISKLSGKIRPKLEYVYELDNFKEHVLNNVVKPPVPRMANIEVRPSGETPHVDRAHEQLYRISAHELPLLAKYRQEYQPPKDSPIQLKFFTDLSDDMSSAENRKVAINVALEELNLNEKQANKFKLLAGNKFNHKNGVFHMKTARFSVATQNARWLVETFNKLLAASKDLSDSFEDVPVNTRHSRPRKAVPEFPEEWKRPQDAPIKKYSISEKIVDMVIEKKDQDYIKQITP
ncbi:hypothetical protein FT663_02058 [Candidozyma haemuli var. vulneris]|uniref:Small ribosomal subunit protein mS35 mitochondrial conserved domain-containing protein n=1 Tax=Candidozyma haemuli TaxID=45357 RepID=A0A2V1AM65_9ASCO|nr:hypothetical protein CXQ85_001283 [[Candida] haemuloni]KAF3989963.1 hypothetical protein FT662_02527 [[Candida] haemuloni var. vulneris]KAF3993049.1 hypothetical protein FT663_02058 [[Candida] haemuloni var. vulneris]PVH18989.1 hypothetical protein CXQ85_001283 [[Candida] haemuloni]